MNALDSLTIIMIIDLSECVGASPSLLVGHINEVCLFMKDRFLILIVGAFRIWLGELYAQLSLLPSFMTSSCFGACISLVTFVFLEPSSGSVEFFLFGAALNFSLRQASKACLSPGVTCFFFLVLTADGLTSVDSLVLIYAGFYIAIESLLRVSRLNALLATTCSIFAFFWSGCIFE